MLFYFFPLSNETCFLLIIVIALFKAVHPQFIRSVEFSEKQEVKYVTTPEDSSLSLFEIKDSYGYVYIDLGRNQSQVIIIRNIISDNLTLLCQIHAPSPSIYERLTHEFCFQIKMSADSKCHTIPNDNTDMSSFNIDFNVIWLENKSGFKLTINLRTDVENDLSGFYYFKSSSPNSGIILSNCLEIRDVLFWEKNMVFSSAENIIETYNHNLTPSDIPKIFSCSDQSAILDSDIIPFWIPLEFISFMKWAWCPVSKQGDDLVEMYKSYVEDCLSYTINKCDKPDYFCPILSGKMPGWKEIISYQGSIALTSGKEFIRYGDRLDGYALMCYYQSKNSYNVLKYIANSYDESGKQFTKGLQWENKINERSNIELISSQNQTIKFGILRKNFILSAFYHAPTEYTYNWIRFDKYMSNTSEWIVLPYYLECRTSITFDMRGTYTLKITTSSESIEFVFSVVILTPPILINTSPEPILSTVYLLVNSDFSIKYSYKGDPTFVNIYINGLLYQHSISDRKIFLEDLANKYVNLNQLDFYFDENKLSDDITEYTYTVKNVLFLETVLRGQDHNIIMEVGNEYGISRSALNIYVLKLLTFISVPRDFNCTTLCSSSESHHFPCELNSDYFTEREVQVQKLWLVNNMRLDSLPYQHLYFQTDEKGLTIIPLSSNSSESDIAVKVLLKEAKLTCRVRLLYPESMNMLDSQMIRENRIIYDTLYDPVFTSQLSTEIRIE